MKNYDLNIKVKDFGRGFRFKPDTPLEEKFLILWRHSIAYEESGLAFRNRREPNGHVWLREAQEYEYIYRATMVMEYGECITYVDDLEDEDDNNGIGFIVYTKMYLGPKRMIRLYRNGGVDVYYR